jgi:acyl-coenzyme A synthetase/AMP-(fatty) acid ligase
MPTLPLLSHDSSHSIVAWRTEGAVTRSDFLAEVSALAAGFPPGKHLLNLCNDRYRFSVGLAAALITGKVSLLPSTHTPGVIAQIQQFAPDVFCLTDSDNCTVALPQLRYPAMPAPIAQTTDTSAVPQIDSAQRVAVVFTSGSTGVPQPHPKTWGSLVHRVQAEAVRLDLPPACTIIGTVPPQHMYGFESTVLMAWQNSLALSHAQPFYPADICHALASVPAPRVLVSSPVHLRALMAAGLTVPAIASAVSATAPLPMQLAREVEARCEAPLLEIYGSTETGQIATRRPTQRAEWQLFPGMSWLKAGDRLRAVGESIETTAPMNDVIEPVTEDLFLLHGRIEDLINIAGKRQSLAGLDHLLNAIPGVQDGAFYMPDENRAAHVTRLAACVVAPGLNSSQVLAALRVHVDPVFLPRPVIFVDTLPRNSTGKLPRAALQALLQAHGVKTTYE